MIHSINRLLFENDVETLLEYLCVEVDDVALCIVLILNYGHESDPVHHLLHQEIILV